MLKPYFEDGDYKLYKGDCLKILKKLEEKSVDIIFADPPYFYQAEGYLAIQASKCW